MLDQSIYSACDLLLRLQAAVAHATAIALAATRSLGDGIALAVRRQGAFLLRLQAAIAQDGYRASSDSSVRSLCDGRALAVRRQSAFLLCFQAAIAHATAIALPATAERARYAMT